MERIVASREADGPYSSVRNLLGRVALKREEARNLAIAGALGSAAPRRSQALWLVDVLLREGCGIARPLVEALDPPCPSLPDWSPLETLEREAAVLGGITPSANPMAVYRPLINNRANGGRPIADLPRRRGTAATVLGVLIAERRARTARGEFMKFLSLEDETGVMEAVLLPDAYQRLGGRVRARGPYAVTGTVEDRFGALSLLVSDVALVAPPKRS
jgi:DNA polymerase III alpha subunit